MSAPEYQCIIIGAGFSGLCMAYELRQSGLDDFVVLEKGESLGGTWRDNTYPGAECDVPSALYSYSFALNPDWNFKWSKQAQILQYMRAFSSQYGLEQQIRFAVTVKAARFDEARSIWHVETDSGELTCRHLISAVGQLHYPKTPPLAGLEQFRGEVFHSAQWNHDIDLKGLDVGVIGSAASAIQFIPEIAKVANRVDIYQRSPNWIYRKGDRAYSTLEKWLTKRLPMISRFRRWLTWFQGERILFPVIQGAPIRSALVRYRCLRYLRKTVADPNLRKKLTPNFPIGAKRLLFSDTFYPALSRSNVTLIDSAIDRVSQFGIIQKNGAERKHDVLIFATGFHSNPFLMGLKIIGRAGKTLAQHWADGAFAYHGVTTFGFPNLLFLYGPNTNTGHTSILLKIESQVRYISQLIGEGGPLLEVREAAEHRFNEEIQSRLAHLAWAKIDASWYKDGDKITNNWPGTEKEYRRRLRTPNWDDFRKFAGSERSTRSGH